MHAVCIGARDETEKDTASRASTIERKIKAGLPRLWNTKRIYTFRQFHASTMSCLLQILLWKWEILTLRY